MPEYILKLLYLSNIQFGRTWVCVSEYSLLGVLATSMYSGNCSRDMSQLYLVYLEEKAYFKICNPDSIVSYGTSAYGHVALLSVNILRWRSSRKCRSDHIRPTESRNIQEQSCSSSVLDRMHFLLYLHTVQKGTINDQLMLLLQLWCSPHRIWNAGCRFAPGCRRCQRWEAVLWY